MAPRILDTISVNGPDPYHVVIGHDLSDAVVSRIQTIGARKVGIVHQPALAAPARQLATALDSLNIEAILLPVPDAEAAKTLNVCGQLWDRLGEENFSRKDAIIGLGGGATTDLAGFVASGWMRGIKVIQVPTTLLAMVDAAVGGKTGINTAAGKNLVGAFHEPDSVFVDLERLFTLPEEELISGSAEIIKTGFIHDPVVIEHYLAEPEACLDPLRLLPELVTRSITGKAEVVGQDLKESGLRETLNYGHTFGHAIELNENYTWRHGNAVAVGMVFAAELAHMRGLIDDDVVDIHRTILRSVGLPTSYSSGQFEQLYAAMCRDKKNKGGGVRFVSLTGIGTTTRIEDATESELLSVFETISKENAQ